MTVMPSFSVWLIGLSALALLTIVNWYVSGFSVKPVPSQRPGEDREDNFRGRNANGEAGEFKKVA